MPRYDTIQQWKIDMQKSKDMAEKSESEAMRQAGERWHSQVQRHKPEYLETLAAMKEKK